jgi:hypothetical protein
MNLLSDLIERVQRRSNEMMRELTDFAMQLEAPDIAQAGFEAYRERLVSDTESPGYTMVMLEREVGQPCQPIVLFIQDFRHLLSRNEAIKFDLDITPVLGEKGWQQFQQQRRVNNIVR